MDSVDAVGISPFSAANLTVSIDGNIGAGKSTVLEYINKNLGIPIDLEAVDKWAPYLERVYKHGDGAFDLQVRVWLDRCFPKTTTPGAILVERSPLFQAGVFVAMNIKANKFTPDQIAIINDMYSLSQIMKPDIYIYLRSDPETCAERINKRARESEDSISIDYLKQLHTLHEATYIEALVDKKRINVIDIEGKSVAAIAALVLQSISNMLLYE